MMMVWRKGVFVVPSAVHGPRANAPSQVIYGKIEPHRILMCTDAMAA